MKAIRVPQEVHNKVLKLKGLLAMKGEFLSIYKIIDKLVTEQIKKLENDLDR